MNHAGPLAVDEACAEATLNGRPLTLTYAQRRVLLALIRRAGRVCRRDEIYEEAFGRAMRPRSRAIDIHVGRVRQALGSAGAALVSVDRVGYRIDLTKLAAFETRS